VADEFRRNSPTWLVDIPASSGETNSFRGAYILKLRVEGGRITVSEPTNHEQDASLAGRRIALVGKLASMSRRDAEQLIRASGASIVEPTREVADTIVVADEAEDLQRLVADHELLDEASRQALARGELEIVRESELWARIGLVDAGQGIARLYTPAMLAELLRAPIAAIRHWHRRGVLVAKREVQRLPYFDFEEVRVARKLAQLLAAGTSLSTINRRLNELSRLLPEMPRPLADPAVVVEGRRLIIRRAGSFSEPSGQLLIDFDASRADESLDEKLSGPVAIPFSSGDALRGPSQPPARGAHPVVSEDLRSLAADLEANGREDQAIDVYRAILISGDFTADDQFALAELLYRGGDLSAARERYYAAIELDEDYVEARSNLGCVLEEQGDLALAEAAFRGALEYHPDYADAHYHLARLLDRENRSAEASRHWQLFMNLAPASPWADEARERIAGEGYRLSAFGPRPEGESSGGRIG
jgi:tetratricopeptide (TPR) repeat protein